MKEKKIDKKEKKVKEKNIGNKEKWIIFNKYLFCVIIFSVIGLIGEIIGGLIISKFIEGRKLITLGPLCIIYGLGAAIIILALEKYNKNKIKLFIYGAIILTVYQYVIGFILEALLGIKLWYYADIKYNWNARICLLYSIIWGISSILIVIIQTKIINKIANLIKGKARIVVDIIVSIILIIYTILNIWGLAVYSIRAKETLNGKNYITNNTIIQKFENGFFTNERMKILFPDMRILDNTGNPIFASEVFEKN